ncbi:hypothetical protein CQY22_003720 [Mycolicibacterium brumae]|uniref:Uncharacterized protein n=2 Tax=Mycolicibacterium brumae TaxID=85968 RepID=A0A2G5PEM6_9MYCO|nr:hypothetical protein CQY22_003720 [Mycolicibacterium brumae]RWA20696.1 hypothetical protein MBRU_03290 [Mycolicibacterium brumae DSM 44177]
MAFAAPANADALGGTYSVQGDALQEGGFTWQFVSCGPDCVSVDGGANGQLTRKGSLWTGVTNAGCNTAIDENTLSGTYECPLLPAFPIQLTKIG